VVIIKKALVVIRRSANGVLAAAALLFALSACGGCPLVIEPFRLTVLTPEGRALISGSSEVLSVPIKLRLLTNSEYDSTRRPIGCGYFRQTAHQVQFRNGSVLLNTDPQEPFEYEWNIVPGADGVPTAGTGEIALRATDDHGVSTEVLRGLVRVTSQ
jgi:hypothetical protein